METVKYMFSKLKVCIVITLRVSEANQVLISSRIIGRLEDIQTALKPLNQKTRKKSEIHFYVHFRTRLIIKKNKPARPESTQS